MDWGILPEAGWGKVKARTWQRSWRRIPVWLSNYNCMKVRLRCKWPIIFGRVGVADLEKT
jgi:hypothetical protein